LTSFGEIPGHSTASLKWGFDMPMTLGAMPRLPQRRQQGSCSAASVRTG
jgi:hypothetical protein